MPVPFPEIRRLPMGKSNRIPVSRKQATAEAFGWRAPWNAAAFDSLNRVIPKQLQGARMAPELPLKQGELGEEPLPCDLNGHPTK